LQYRKSENKFHEIVVKYKCGIARSFRQQKINRRQLNNKREREKQKNMYVPTLQELCFFSRNRRIFTFLFKNTVSWRPKLNFVSFPEIWVFLKKNSSRTLCHPRILKSTEKNGPVFVVFDKTSPVQLWKPIPVSSKTKPSHRSKNVFWSISSFIDQFWKSTLFQLVDPRSHLLALQELVLHSKQQAC
jgi:hypothetical protein